MKKKLQTGAYVTRCNGKHFRPFAVRKTDGVKIGIADVELNVIVMPIYEWLEIEEDDFACAYIRNPMKELSFADSLKEEYDAWYIDLNTGKILSSDEYNKMTPGLEDLPTRKEKDTILSDLDILHDREEQSRLLNADKECMNEAVYHQQTEDEVKAIEESDNVLGVPTDEYLYGIKDDIADFYVMPNNSDDILISYSDDEWSEAIADGKRRLKVGAS